MLLSFRLFDSSQIVINLKRYRSQLGRLQDSLTNLHWHYEKPIFETIKKNLLGVLNNLNKIVRLDSRKLNRVTDPDFQLTQTEYAHLLAKVSYRSLVEARKLLSELKTKCFTENDNVDFDNISSDFNDVIKITSTTVSELEPEFDKFDYPELTLLEFNPNEPTKYLSVHKNILLFALANFVYPVNGKSSELLFDTFSSLNKNLDAFSSSVIANKATFNLYSEQLARLSQELNSDVDLILNDYKKSKSGIVARESSSLNRFIDSMNSFKPGLDLSLTDIQKTMEGSDDEYRSVINRLIKSFANSNDPRISFAPLIRASLLLQALRIKNQAPDDRVIDFDLAAKAKVFAANDRLGSSNLEYLKEVHAATRKYLFGLESNWVIDAMAHDHPELRDILRIDSAQKTIITLKKEFLKGISQAFEFEESVIYKLYKDKDYQLIFIKAGIDQKKLMELDQARNNVELAKVLDCIYETTLRYNSISPKDAMRLIYILGYSLDSRNKSHENCSTKIPLTRFKSMRSKLAALIASGFLSIQNIRKS